MVSRIMTALRQVQGELAHLLDAPTIEDVVELWI
jgi:hypothetical protein